ncbi:diguanylate cyclase with GAF sensor [Natranaerovirga pectinivora]|uniref:Diguanylate cyclase with GAF sensor n=1 Tax=Natranaerovirga pectinivora TaxID=682400 RepID=A0A4R3MP91_9FIRM|nr:sensor domain-containing diguanylate cyclase [Natranaerovirga pectinivora]TCT17105.1 diguanylate cyclase with GAF sensor [Natranaerovirga pectinivora]
MDRLLRYEKTFINIHNNIAIAVLIYILIFTISGRADELLWIYVILAVVSHGINYFIFKFDFFNKIQLFYSIKYVQILLSAFFAFEQVNYTEAIGSIFYLLLFIEVIIATGRHSKLSQYILSAVFIFPIIISYIFAAYTFNYPENIGIDIVFFMSSFIIVIMGLGHIISEYAIELNDQIDIQRNLVFKTKQSNEELITTQKKFQEAHEKLTVQNTDLEQAYKKLNRASSEMYIQNELLKYISSSLEIDELMDMVTDSIIGAIGVDTCSIIIYDDNRDVYQFKIKSTYSKDYTKSLEQFINEGKFDKYFKSTKAFTDNNVEQENYSFLDDRTVGSLMIMPLIRNNLTYGLLIAEQKTNNTFVDNIQFFEGIATQIIIAISNANLYTKMEEMATHDGLTGVYNRTYLQTRFSEIVREAIMNKSCISVALFDIDKFKRINDTYGHLFGDEVIKMAARVTEKIVSINKGLVGRFGGEEFVMIFPNKSVNETLEVVKEVQEAINSEVLYHNGEKVIVNVSTGITNYPDICKNPSELLNRADLAMYYSKENGRGIITVDNDTLSK